MIRLVLRVLLYVIITLDCIHAAELTNCGFEMMRVNTVEPVSNDIENSFKMPYFLTAVRLKLREIFANQHPNIKINFRDFYIENWPVGIDPFSSCMWTKSELRLINERIPYIRFVPMKPIVEADYPGKHLRRKLEKMECLKNVVLKKENFKKEMMAILLARYKMESDQPYAKQIRMNLLDRRNIPAKYNDVTLNSASVSHQLIFKNPEIIDNIHFYRHDFLIYGFKAIQTIRNESNTETSNDSVDDYNTEISNGIGIDDNTGIINESVKDNNIIVNSDVSNGQECQLVSCRHDLIIENDDEQEIDNFVTEFDKSHYGFDIEIDGCDLAKYCEFLQGSDSNNTEPECSIADNIYNGIEKLERKRKFEYDLVYEDIDY